MIYLDMDGVIVDFTTAYLELMNSKYKHDDIEDWNLYLYTNQTEREFWNTLDLAGLGFWENIPIYSYTIDMIKRLREIDDVTILTSVSEFAPIAAIGKIKWLNKYINPMIPICIDTEKWKYAHSKALLIDDKIENIEKFIECGGNGLLFKQPWNKAGDHLPSFDFNDYSRCSIIKDPIRSKELYEGVMKVLWEHDAQAADAYHHRLYESLISNVPPSSVSIPSSLDSDDSNEA